MTKGLHSPHEESTANHSPETPYPGSENISGWTAPQQDSRADDLLVTSHTIADDTRGRTTGCPKMFMELAGGDLKIFRNNVVSLIEATISLVFYGLKYSVHVNMFIEHFI